MTNASEPRFAIGQRFTPVGKRAKECTITDILRTYDSKGVLVRVCYVATHDFCGQQVEDHDVLDTTIARGLFAKGLL